MITWRLEFFWNGTFVVKIQFQFLFLFVCQIWILHRFVFLQIRGKDLAGAIKVMPMGMDAAIKKRVSGEFKSEVRREISCCKNCFLHDSYHPVLHILHEPKSQCFTCWKLTDLWNAFLKLINFYQQRGATVSFSNAEQSSSMKRETKQQQLTSFAEEKCEEVRSVGTPFQQAGFQAAPLQEKNSLFNSNQQENSFSSSSMVNNQQNSFSSQQQMSSSTSVQKSQQQMTSSQSSSKSFSSMQSSNLVQKVRSNFWI